MGKLYPAETALRVGEVTRRELYHWAGCGIAAPSTVGATPRGRASYRWNRRDLVALALVRRLRATGVELAACTGLQRTVRRIREADLPDAHVVLRVGDPHVRVVAELSDFDLARPAMTFPLAPIVAEVDELLEAAESRDAAA